MSWTWDEDQEEYVDDDTGTVVLIALLIELRDLLADDASEEMRRLMERLIAEEITVEQWIQYMRELIERVFGVQYTIGRGGPENMTDADWEAVAALILTQWEFLQNFAGEILDGTATGLAARAAYYGQSSRLAFGWGQASARGLDLPQVPGDCQTACCMNCKCYLVFDRQSATLVHVYWVRTAQESCPDCIRLEQEWNPYEAET